MNDSVLKETFDVIESRKSAHEEGSYTYYLFSSGIDKILKKVGEECTETVIAAKNLKLGAGEILLTSMDADGTKNGFDIPLTKLISGSVNIPVIASGGAGRCKDFADVFKETGADAALAASLFHFRELSVGEVKQYLKDEGIWVRL